MIKSGVIYMQTYANLNCSKKLLKYNFVRSIIEEAAKYIEKHEPSI